MGGKDRESKKDRAGKAQAEKEAHARKAAEDASWEASDKKDKKKAGKAESEADRKAAQQAKALAKKQAEEEDNAALASMKGAKKKDEGRLTRAQIEANLAAEKRPATAGKNKNVQAQKFDTVNTNRLIDEDSATGLDDALKLMSTTGKAEEVKRATAHKEFEERMIPQLKAQSPGLKLSQYKEMAWKIWQKSPENPANQN
mmetsp:Transcript_50586/g.90358  ORF Transcript_50586/g.90358 Transcript_50586/m.90358 type:complete len:200 (-) Transcript_50586:1319-1918(-)